MSRRYQEPITVTLGPSWLGEGPVAFTWRGRAYRVKVLATRHLQDRWWDTERHADRTYWRVLVPATLAAYELFCENGRDWVLDLVLD
jgi:hypothetical protein